MSRTVFLHVGAPKTGTTYLQDRLAANARSLKRHGVHFPSANLVTSAPLSQFRAALDLREQDWGGEPGHARGAWPAMLKRVGRLDGTVVISHEILAPAPADQVRRARDDLHGLGDTEVHVVDSARDLGRQVPAAWQESIKQGRIWTYRQFQRRLVAGRTWFAHAFDLPSVLGTWSADLPPGRVHLVTVPQDRGGDVLWGRFCQVFGIDPAWAPSERARGNPSMGVAETQLLVLLNRRLRRRGLDPNSYDRIVRETLAQGTLANRRGTRLQLPPELHPWAVAEAERWAGWLADHEDVEVVGDVAELLPGPAVDPQAYRQPAAAPARAQLNAALDALVLMTQESARRKDPDTTYAARARTWLRER